MYTTTGAGLNTAYTYKVTVTAASNAAPGFRIAIATAAAGNTQAAVMGVHILRSSTKPGSLTTTIANQLLGIFDFTSLDTVYWE